MADAHIGGTLPVGDANGLAAIAAELIEDPGRLHVMIAVIDCAKVTTKTDTGDRLATVRVRRIERVLPDDHGAAEVLMRRSLEQRTGHTVLPLELEDDLRAAFAEIEAQDADDDQGEEGDNGGEDE